MKGHARGRTGCQPVIHHDDIPAPGIMRGLILEIEASAAFDLRQFTLAHHIDLGLTQPGSLHKCPC